LLKPVIHIKVLDAELPVGIEEYLWELFKPRVDALIAEKLGSAGQAVNEYMPKEYFMSAYSIGKTTFHNILKAGRINKHQEFDHKVYNVEQFKKALQFYKPEKPLIKKSLVKAV
jgi:hypothetical protein